MYLYHFKTNTFILSKADLKALLAFTNTKRQDLYCVHFDAKYRNVVVTDGHTLLCGTSSYGPAETPIRSFSLSVYTLKRALKVLPAKGEVHISESTPSQLGLRYRMKCYTETCVDPEATDTPQHKVVAVWDNVEPHDYVFPDYRALQDGKRGSVSQIQLNCDYIGRIGLVQKCAGTGGGTFTMGEDDLSPVYINIQDCRATIEWQAMIMPMRMD